MGVPCREAGRLVFSVGDALADSLVQPPGVVVLVILGQDGEQMRGAEDQHPVQGLLLTPVHRCSSQARQTFSTPQGQPG